MPKLLDLLLPTPCVSCSKIGSPFCLECRSQFETRFIPIEISGVYGFAISDYSPMAAVIVNSMKEKGLTSLIPLVAQLMVPVWPAFLGKPCLVPLPSSPTNDKRRGFSHTQLLSGSLARALPDGGNQNLLRSTKDRMDQVGLNPSERNRNMDKAFEVRRRNAIPADQQIVLVDDVFTSGSSMRSAISALTEAGLEVAGFCVFARAGAK
jgi:predicted amidophosphoribosyltransferase